MKPRSRRSAHRLRGPAITLVALSLAQLSPGTATADKHRSRVELERLTEQAEVITEQYNGQRVALERVTRTKSLLEHRVAQAQRAVELRRRDVAPLIAARYMHGGLDPVLALAGEGGNQQATLNQMAVISYLTAEHAARLQRAADADRRLSRARDSAAIQQSKITALVNELAKKKTQVDLLVARIETRLGRGGRGNRPSAPTTDLIQGQGKGSDATRWALTQVGKPYKWGAEGPDSYDCSGLTLWAYAKVGVALPHYTGDQWTAGTQVSRSELKPGDLVFFYKDLHHMGMYIGNGQMVHAPQAGDFVKVGPITGRPWAGAVRVVA